MSTWTNNAAALALTLATLVACVAPGSFTSTRSAPVLNGALNVGVPAGYCVDRRASRESRDTAVILMGRCADNLSAAAAVITVSVGQPASGGVMTAGGPALAAFFRSSQGRATLSRDGRAGDVQLLQVVGLGNAMMLLIRDRRQGDYWRAVVAVKGRLVTLSATGTDRAPLPPAEGRKLLDRSLAALEQANQP